MAKLKKNNLSMVEDIKIPHCYKSCGFERIINYSMHHFSDVCECGYGKARLIKYTRGEPPGFFKNFINDRAHCGCKNTIVLLQKQYGNPHIMLSSHRKEIKWMQPLKPGVAAAFQRLFNFLIKCQTVGVGSKHNPLDTPEMICMILAKLPPHLQARQN